VKQLFLENKTGPYAEIHDWILFLKHKAGLTQTPILLSLFRMPKCVQGTVIVLVIFALVLVSSTLVCRFIFV
jgi:hypothetical protein